MKGEEMAQWRVCARSVLLFLGPFLWQSRVGCVSAECEALGAVRGFIFVCFRAASQN